MRNFFYGSGRVNVQRNDRRLFHLATRFVMPIDVVDQHEHEREQDDDAEKCADSASHAGEASK